MKEQDIKIMQIENKMLKENLEIANSLIEEMEFEGVLTGRGEIFKVSQFIINGTKESKYWQKLRLAKYPGDY